ncbi:MAG TPA: Maf family protein [Vicinamibacterales bacterium]|nr:Maf family protein [Vicinamibacterales bacterium]
MGRIVVVADRPFVLASASPRRAELLTLAGFRFTVDPADVDETEHPGEQPDAYVLRVARDKARTVAARQPGRIVLAADTTVVAGGAILAKPADEVDAVRMLELLSDAVHDVWTGVVLLGQGREAADSVLTRVHFRPISAEEIRWYVASGEPMGKAGAYGIQGRAARFVDRIEGSWANVVGLPVHTVDRLLKAVAA